MKYYIFFFIALVAVEAGKLTRQKRALSVDRATFMAQNLQCHNSNRVRHQVAPLTYSDQLNTFAQNYAESLAYNDTFKHSGGPYGENLYAAKGGTTDGNSACNSWYAENKDYNYNLNDPPNFNQVGHFTQLVWKGSSQIGIGYATSKSGWLYIVAEYSPPGNYKGQYKANVFPPTTSG